MYISGENIVVKPYTPVDAYAVMPMGDGVASGETGNGNVVVAKTRFFWEYIPDDPGNSGFTGAGWFCEVPNTPLADITEEELIRQFKSGERTNLDAEFAKWQEFVTENPTGNWVTKFTFMIALAGGTESCVFTGQ